MLSCWELHAYSVLAASTSISPYLFRLMFRLLYLRICLLVDLSHMGDVMGGTDELNLIIKVEDTASRMS